MVALILALALAASPAPAPTVSPSAPGSGSGAPPDGTYSYSFRQGSDEIGTAVIAVAHAAAAIHLHEIASLSGRSFTVDQFVDPATLAPAKIDAIYPGAKPAAIHIVFSPSGATETVAGFPGNQTLKTPSGCVGGIVLDGPVISGFVILPAQANALHAKSLEGISPASAATMALALDPTEPATRPAGAPSADRAVTISGLQSGSITIWFDAATFVVHDLEIPSQGLSIVLVKQSASPAITATAAPAPTPLPTAPPHFTSHDITFRSSDGTVLAGTLTIPDGVRRNAPAAVLIHGSGPTNRDEQVGPNPIFLQLSNALSNHGFVVLRYDKRGIGKSGGSAATLTRDQLLADARSAIAFVAARPVVDPKRVYAIGHSEGGELAPSLAAGGAPLRGIALMAPPAIPLDQILLQQASRGLSGDAAKKARAEQERANFAIRTGLSDAPGGAWLRTSFGIDPAQVIAHVPCPILILQGGKDFQVLARDLPRLVNAAKAAHRDVTVRIFPNDDHLFIPVPSKQAATPSEYFVPHRVDPAMLRALIAWLDARDE